ncbi:MAG: hypothetical protein Q7N50_03225 [Armatimonadota bacterium]|nr:hypothetical protein [Armatimonadota bacterium]
MTQMVAKRLDDLFLVKSGDIHALSEVEPDGDVPVIACGDTGHGFVGFFNVPVERRHRASLTVAYNGSWPLLSKFHPYEFAAKDDVAILTPRHAMRHTTLFYIAAVLNTMTWRYSYYRHCYRDKVKKTIITVPMTEANELDEDAIARFCRIDVKRLAPTGKPELEQPFKMTWDSLSVTRLFDVKRGDFHSIAALDRAAVDSGVMTVSRIADDNGVVGRFERPEGAQVYPSRRITVSTVSGDAFVQLSEFVATDNVLILTPKALMNLATLFFVALMLNQQKWRYSYSRQPYRAKFTSTKIWMPMNKGAVDQAAIETLTRTATYWSTICGYLSK